MLDSDIIELPSVDTLLPPTDERRSDVHLIQPLEYLLDPAFNSFAVLDRFLALSFYYLEAFSRSFQLAVFRFQGFDPALEAAVFFLQLTEDVHQVVQLFL